MPDLVRFPPGFDWTRLRRSADGNVTTLTALAIMTMVFAAGSAIDYARLLSTRTALAAATDAAALQIGNSALTDQAALENLARSVVLRNYSEAQHGELIGLDLNVSGYTVDLATKVRFRTTFMRLAGLDNYDLPVSSQVTKSGNNLEIALVLDVTGSMAGNKINALKDAATDFVNKVVWNDQSQFYSKVALVPYSAGVNVGAKAAAARGSISAGTCSTPGCTNYKFKNANGANRTLAISTCVSERTGANAYTDVSPSVAPVGRNYAAPANPCLASEMKPLSANKSAILADIDSLHASGSTAGQIGIAWGWYALSKDFGLWTGANQPAAYGTERVSKIAVIMTDGQFNTGYCNGVIAKNSGNGSGNADDKINCNAPNGSSSNQATQLCTAMKNKGIVIYTIGFDIGGDAAAQAVMTDCASGADRAYLAATSQELSEVFAAIGKRLTALRLSL